MKHLLILLPLALTACVQSRVVQPVNLTVADKKIAQITTQVNNHCSQIQTVMMFVNYEASTSKGQAIIEEANAAIQAYCAAPPVDVVSALDTLARIYSNVVAVKKGRV